MPRWAAAGRIGVAGYGGLRGRDNAQAVVGAGRLQAIVEAGRTQAVGGRAVLRGAAAACRLGFVRPEAALILGFVRPAPACVGFVRNDATPALWFLLRK